MPVDSIFTECPALHVKKEWKKLTDNGNSFFPNQTVENMVHSAGEWVRVYVQDGGFVGIYAYDDAKEWYKPVKMFME
jgi:tRNA U55 pseudouridine synthase TruB